MTGLCRKRRHSTRPTELLIVKFVPVKTMHDISTIQIIDGHPRRFFGIFAEILGGGESPGWGYPPMVKRTTLVQKFVVHFKQFLRNSIHSLELLFTHFSDTNVTTWCFLDCGVFVRVSFIHKKLSNENTTHNFEIAQDRTIPRHTPSRQLIQRAWTQCKRFQ